MAKRREVCSGQVGAPPVSLFSALWVVVKKGCSSEAVSRARQQDAAARNEYQQKISPEPAPGVLKGLVTFDSVNGSPLEDSGSGHKAPSGLAVQLVGEDFLSPVAEQNAADAADMSPPPSAAELSVDCQPSNA